MQGLIRKILAKSIGFESYLKFVSRTYLELVNRGLLKGKYPELFFLDHLVRDGFVCIDIGANVGYYTTRLSRLSGQRGQVFAVEPVQTFYKILQQNVARFGIPNVQLLPFALGSENKSIKMGTPVIDGVIRHGLTHVVESGDKQQYAHLYNVPMKVPDEIFNDLERLDFIKCDVEGYEAHLFPHLLNTISKFKPVIQVEISSNENREKLNALLSLIGYNPYRLKNNQLIKMSKEEMLKYDSGDFYFKL